MHHDDGANGKERRAEQGEFRGARHGGRENWVWAASFLRRIHGAATDNLLHQSKTGVGDWNRKASKLLISLQALVELP